MTVTYAVAILSLQVLVIIIKLAHSVLVLHLPINLLSIKRNKVNLEDKLRFWCCPIKAETKNVTVQLHQDMRDKFRCCIIFYKKFLSLVTLLKVFPSDPEPVCF